jgi:hypothetical protein
VRALWAGHDGGAGHVNTAVDPTLFWTVWRVVTLCVAVVVMAWAFKAYGAKNPWSTTVMGGTGLLIALDEIRLININAPVLIWRQVLYVIIMVAAIQVIRKDVINP